MVSRRELVRLVRSIERVEGIVADIIDEVRVGTSIKIGKIYQITVDDYGVTALHIPSGKLFKIYVGPIDKTKAQLVNNTVSPKIAVNDTYPDDYEPVTIAPEYPYDTIIPVRIDVDISGVDVNSGETITVEIHLVHEDGTVTVIPIIATGDGTKTLRLSDDILPNISGDKSLVGMRIWSKTNLSSTNATVKVTVMGIKI